MQTSAEAHASITFRRSAALWIAGTTSAWAVGFLPVLVVITGASCCHGDSGTAGGGYIILFGMVACLFAASLVVSGSQSTAMQRVLGYAQDRWMWLGTLGMFVGWILGWIASIPVFPMVEDNTLATWVLVGAVTGAITGFLTGFFQLLLLHRLRIARLWWVGVTMIGWICASALYWLVYAAAGGPFHATYTYYEDGFEPKSADAPGALPAMLLAWLVGGLVLSLITGGGMLTLLRGVKASSQE